MTWSRYDRPKRVVQSYLRLGEEDYDNPYPTIASAGQAIEERTSPTKPEHGPQTMEPRPRVPELFAAKVFDARDLVDDVISKKKPGIPPSHADETLYPLYWWGIGEQVRPKTKILPDPLRPGWEIIRSSADPQKFESAYGVAHTHPVGADPYPGPEDWKVPVQHGKPSYVATENNIFRINPPDASGRLSVDLIQGEWGRPDAEVQAAIERMNRRETVGHTPGKRR